MNLPSNAAEPDYQDNCGCKEQRCYSDGHTDDEGGKLQHERDHASPSVNIRLPWPPSANALWRSVRGKVVRSEPYKTWWSHASWELAAQRPEKHKGPVRLSIRLKSPTQQAYDPDNRLKACLDLLKALHVIEADDHRIVRSITVEVADTGEPGARINITPHEGMPT